jgi:glutathione S-transferase
VSRFARCGLEGSSGGDFDPRISCTRCFIIRFARIRASFAWCWANTASTCAWWKSGPGNGARIPGAGIIAEYLDETHGLEAAERRLLPVSMAERVEVRRLMAWFNDKFFEEVSNPLVTERIYKRFMSEENGGGAPSTDVIRAAKVNVRYHLAYIGWLAQTRNFLAGDRLTYADLAAAAHLSAIDYLGDVPWHEDEAAKAWYARVKSRPSFRPLLSEWLAGVPASRTYVDLDF